MDPSLRDAMELCRNRDDLELPELNDLRVKVSEDPQLRDTLDRVIQEDDLIREHIADVDVPDNLQSEILAQLKSQPASTSRRRSMQGLAWGAVVAAAGLILAFLSQWGGRVEPIDVTVEQLQALAKDEWVRDILLIEESEWLAVRDLPTTQLHGGPNGRMVRREFNLLGHAAKADVYRLSGANAGYLLAVKLPADVSVAGISRGPGRCFVTGGWAIGVWQEGQTLMVLVVPGTKSDFEARIKRLELT